MLMYSWCSHRVDCGPAKFLFSVKTVTPHGQKVKVKQTSRLHMNLGQCCLSSVKVVFLMAWFSYNRLYSVFEWLWRRLGVLCRCVTSMLRPIVGYAFLAVAWRKNPGRRQGGCEDCEGQYGAAAGVSAEREAGRDREPASELSGYEEEDDEDGEFNKEKCHVESGREEDDDDDEFDSVKYRVETTDEFYCGYDSTWETEENTPKRARRSPASRHVSKPKAFHLWPTPQLVSL